MHYSARYLSTMADAQRCVKHAEALQGCSILITGGGGLICSMIADFLLVLNDTAHLGMQVYVSDKNLEQTEKRFGEWLIRKDLTVLAHDITQPISDEYAFDYIIHGASFASPAAFSQLPVEVMLANIIGMRNVLDYAHRHHCRRVLYISSSEVYGPKSGPDLYDEAHYYGIDPLNPRSCYPMSKRAAETLCVSFLKEYGTDSVIVRPGHIYGPTANKNDNRAATQFLANAVAGQDIVMKSAGSQLRSYCYVVDCVTAIVHVLLHGEKGQAYNISNPDSVVTIRDLAECIAAQAGVKVVFECATDAEKASYNMMDNSALDATRLLALGWKGMFNLEQGVGEALQIIRESME
ncbi:MAG: NAD-dependent epimerase/dehydratase family protein [Aristaeellaceae bacterium]